MSTPKEPQTDLLAIVDGANQIMEMASAYRSSAIAHDFSPTAAERMTIDYHKVMLGLIFKTQGDQ